MSVSPPSVRIRSDEGLNARNVGFRISAVANSHYQPSTSFLKLTPFSRSIFRLTDFEVYTFTVINLINPVYICHGNPGGGGYSIYPWVCRYGPAPHTLTLFKTNIADFATLFTTEFRFLIPYIRQVVWLSCCVINGNLMCLVSMPKSTEVNISSPTSKITFFVQNNCQLDNLQFTS